MVIKRGERGDKDKGAKRYKCWNRGKSEERDKGEKGKFKEEVKGKNRE